MLAVSSTQKPHRNFRDQFAATFAIYGEVSRGPEISVWPAYNGYTSTPSMRLFDQDEVIDVHDPWAAEKLVTLQIDLIAYAGETYKTVAFTANIANLFKCSLLQYLDEDPDSIVFAPNEPYENPGIEDSRFVANAFNARSGVFVRITTYDDELYLDFACVCGRSPGHLVQLRRGVLIAGL